MPKKYKIWLHLEEIDEENDIYFEPVEPVALAEFDIEDKAQQVFDSIINLSMIFKE